MNRGIDSQFRGLVLLTAAAALAWGCSSSSSGGGGSSSSGSGSSTGSSSSGGSSSGGGSEVICQTKSGNGVPGCTLFEDLSSAAAMSAASGCTSGGGTVVSACPSGMVGCCTIPSSGPGVVTQEICFYSGTASSLQSTCGSTLHGNWSTSP